MALITKDNLNKAYSSHLNLLKNPTKSDLKEGDVCIIRRKDSFNLFVFVKKDTVKWSRANGDNCYLLGSNGFIEFQYYDENLKLNRNRYNSDIFDIILVFKTHLSSINLKTRSDFMKSITGVYNEILDEYPKEAKEIIL